MKLTERSNGLYLEDIEAKNVRFANLAGRLTGSIYEDPDRPKHAYVLWIDEDIVESLRDLNLNVKEVNELDRIMRGSNEDRKREVEQDRKLQKELAGINRYSLEFKAYPKTQQNRKTGRKEQYPKIMLRSTGGTVRLEKESFGLVDAAHIQTVDIRFHAWQYDARKPSCVAVIDELWCTVDEGAGEIDDDYLDNKYEYSESEEADEAAAAIDEEEMPFR